MRSIVILWLLIATVLAILAEGSFARELGSNMDVAQPKSTTALRHSMITTPTTLRKRTTTYPVVGGWQLRVMTYASLLPLEIAAETLEKFYRDISTRAGFQMVQDHFYRLRLGKLALEFFCQERPVSWVLVQDFTRIMAEAARKGWTGSYSMYYFHPIKKVTVAIQLLWME